MIKGCQRETILVKCDEGSRFESVFFVVKKNSPPATRESLIREANAFIGEREESAGKKRRQPPALLTFVFGLICGSAFTSLIIFLLTK